MYKIKLNKYDLVPLQNNFDGGMLGGIPNHCKYADFYIYLDVEITNKYNEKIHINDKLYKYIGYYKSYTIQEKNTCEYKLKYYNRQKFVYGIYGVDVEIDTDEGQLKIGDVVVSLIDKN